MEASDKLLSVVDIAALVCEVLKVHPIAWTGSIESPPAQLHPWRV